MGGIYELSENQPCKIIMDTAKIYYAVMVLLIAVSVLLSPFFYIRRSRPRMRQPVSHKGRIIAVVGNVLTLALIAWVCWWLWRKG